MGYGLIVTTTSSIDEAKRIAHNLVENKLAACANIVPKITSIYSWKGEIHEDEEFMILVKTRKCNFEEVRQNIIKLHSYELPEIIMLSIKKGHEDYLSWIKNETIESTLGKKWKI